MTIASRPMGEFDGRRVDGFTLESAEGVRVEIMTWGVTVRDWRVPVDDTLRPVVLGFDAFAPYPEHSPFFGSVVGRVANRVRGAAFELDGVRYELPANDGPHQLHGGRQGIGRQVWEAEPDSDANAVRFRHVSPDGAMGYPGRVEFEAVYTLRGKRLILDLSALPDRTTPVSLTQHHYFNLGTTPDVLDHRLWVASRSYTPTGEDHCATGAILHSAGTPYDFRNRRSLRNDQGQAVDYDVNLVIDPLRDTANPAAILVGPDGVTLRLWTGQTGLQIYNSAWNGPTPPGIDGRHHGPHAGLCLEDQALPGALGHAHFPSIMVTPEAPYVHRTEIEIG
jgi:aldose 1-epimerase